MRGPGSIPTWDNILLLDFFHVVKSLMPILALLPILSICEKHDSDGWDLYVRCLSVLTAEIALNDVTQLQHQPVSYILTNYFKRGSTQAEMHSQSLALKPRADVSPSPKQEYQWSHGKDWCPSKLNNTVNNKVLFSKACVKNSVHGEGGLSQCMLVYHTPWDQASPPLDQAPPLGPGP